MSKLFFATNFNKIFYFFLFKVFPMDEQSAAGGRQHPPRGRLLPGIGSAQHTAQDTHGRHTRARDACQVPRGQPASQQRAHVPAHMRPQPSQTA